VQVNAPVALLLGFASGLGKRVLVLQEQPNGSLLDLGSIIRPFEGEKSARSFVEHWIRSESEALLQQGTRSVQQERRNAQVHKVRDLFLGSPDAMVDYNLMDYYVTTPQYRQALNGVKQLFVGRKGVGKSATFRAIQEDLGRRQKAILVCIAPSDFQFERLAGLLADQYTVLHPALVYQSFWRYIILTEVLKTIWERYAYFFQSPIPPHIEQLLSFMREQEAVLEQDFASRAIGTLDALQRVPTDLSNVATEAELEKLLFRARMYQIERLLQRLAQDYPIYVLVDDIDKHWNPSYDASVQLLLGLVNEATQIHGRFKGGLNVALFLRQDIFEILRRRDEELVKRNIATLRWDEPSLLRMIGERIAYYMQSKVESDEDGGPSYCRASFRVSLHGAT